uniref:Ig-like domain-containing protein n=1 Tax=Xiphophorus maculatus TaxID=8083 RepID=A0A3B5R1K2_XIPMA
VTHTIQLNFHLFLFLIADTETSVSCVINQDCILPCRFKNGVTVMEWESKTSSLIVSYDHRGFSYSESFRSRASLFEDQISRGNGDLLLRGVKVDDEGRYRCTAKINGIYYTNLVVLPIEVSTFRIHQDGNRITCSSEGIYPQPELTWSTEPPSNTTLQNRTTVHQTEEKLYDISSSLTVPDCSDRIYSCTIRTQLTFAGTKWWRATLAEPGQQMYRKSRDLIISIADLTLDHIRTTVACLLKNPHGRLSVK